MREIVRTTVSTIAIIGMGTTMVIVAGIADLVLREGEYE